MSSTESIALIIKVEQLGLLKQAAGLTYREASEVFDRFGVWDLVDAAYEGFHVQGASATFEDIRSYLQAKDAGLAI
ncbi:MAG: DUF3791 domain-containing protein [Coriobacteriales bacterium]|nr:DUF3791 domain-containing protein [Coriobacteriales bacterium]